MAIRETFILSDFYRSAPSHHLLTSVPAGLGKANTEHALKRAVRPDSGQSWNAVTVISAKYFAVFQV